MRKQRSVAITVINFVAARLRRTMEDPDVITRAQLAFAIRGYGTIAGAEKRAKRSLARA